MKSLQYRLLPISKQLGNILSIEDLVSDKIV